MKTISIDYGEKRIGLAISDELGIIASPMPTLKVKSLADAVSKVHRIVKSQRAENIVVGLPLSLKGTETQQSIQTRYFVDTLKATNGANIEFWNEAFTTQQAKSSTRKGTSRKKRNIDSEAARIILQEYLDSNGKSKTKTPFCPHYDKLLLK